MFSSRFVKHVKDNQSAWKVAAGIIVVGATFKVTYFNFSRGLMVNHMERRHLAATEHLIERREFWSKMTQTREAKVPPLTPEQKEQLQEYLRLMRMTEPDVYPKESGRWDWFRATILLELGNRWWVKKCDQIMIDRWFYSDRYEQCGTAAWVENWVIASFSIKKSHSKITKLFQ